MTLIKKKGTKQQAVFDQSESMWVSLIVDLWHTIATKQRQSYQL